MMQENYTPNEVIDLTDEQVHEVYETLKDVDKESQDNLAKAQEMTENTEYNEIEEINTESSAPVNEKYIDGWVNSASNYGIFREDAIALIPIMQKYNKDKSIKVFDDLPESIKTIARSIALNNSTKRNRMSKESAAKLLLDTFILDVSMDEIVDEYNREILNITSETSESLHKSIDESYQEMFDKIDEIRKTDPDMADRIKLIKDSFEDAESFKRQSDYVNYLSKKKLEKWTLKFKDECSYFNKKVNTFDSIRVPDISELVDIIKLYLPQFSENDIKKFIVVISRSTLYYENALDMTKIENVAYIYRLIDSIYRYKNSTPAVIDETAQNLFTRLSIVISKIKNL